MADSNPNESLDIEGVPDIEERAPGMDVELDEESLMAPRDRPVAAGADPAYAVTEAEDRTRESVADRAARENPEVGAGRARRSRPAPQQAPDGGTERYVLGAFSNRLSQSEADAQGVDADDPLVPERYEQYHAGSPTPAETALLDPDAEQGLDSDDESQLVSDAGEATDATGAEESAVHVRREA